MKKTIIFLFAALAALTLAGCGTDNNTDNSSDSGSSAVQSDNTASVNISDSISTAS